LVPICVTIFLNKHKPTPPDDGGLCYYWVVYEGDRSLAEIVPKDSTPVRDLSVRVIDVAHYYQLSWEEMCGGHEPPSAIRRFSIPQVITQGLPYRDRDWPQSDSEEYNISFSTPLRSFAQVLERVKVKDHWSVATRVVPDNAPPFDRRDPDFPPDEFDKRFGWLTGNAGHGPRGWLGACVGEPTVDSEVVFNGWAADLREGAPVQKVEVTIDDQIVGSATLGSDRCDVVGLNDRPTWLKSGWWAAVKLSGLNPGSHRVSAIAYNRHGESAKLADGPASRIEVKPAPLTPGPSPRR
jgi:hypothetical protein